MSSGSTLAADIALFDTSICALRLGVIKLLVEPLCPRDTARMIPCIASPDFLAAFRVFKTKNTAPSCGHMLYQYNRASIVYVVLTAGEYPSASGEKADERPLAEATLVEVAQTKAAGVKCVAIAPTITMSALPRCRIRTPNEILVTQRKYHCGSYIPSCKAKAPLAQALDTVFDIPRKS